MLPGDALFSAVQDTVPVSITHRDTSRSVTVLAKTVPGPDYFDSEILAALKPKLEEMQYDPTASKAEYEARWPRG